MAPLSSPPPCARPDKNKSRNVKAFGVATGLVFWETSIMGTPLPVWHGQKTDWNKKTEFRPSSNLECTRGELGMRQGWKGQGVRHWQRYGQCLARTDFRIYDCPLSHRRQFKDNLHHDRSKAKGSVCVWLKLVYFCVKYIFVFTLICLFDFCLKICAFFICSFFSYRPVRKFSCESSLFADPQASQTNGPAWVWAKVGVLICLLLGHASREPKSSLALSYAVINTEYESPVILTRVGQSRDPVIAAPFSFSHMY